jgi:hypothetical protein
MDAHILSDNGNGLLLARAIACVDRNYQGILELTHYPPDAPNSKAAFSEWRVTRPDAVDERLADLSLVARVFGFGDQGTENWDRESSY